jgi:hypothetical protein
MENIFSRKPVTLKEYASWANVQLAKSNIHKSSNDTEAYFLEASLAKADFDYKSTVKGKGAAKDRYSNKKDSENVQFLVLPKEEIEVSTKE